MQRTTADVIVNGGGVAGLSAAGELSRCGCSVIIVEARDRLGGRVWTQRRPGWNVPVELGAQFVHGGNRTMWNLLQRHRIKTQRVPARHWLQSDSEFLEIDATREIAAVTKNIAEKRMNGWSFARFMAEAGDKFTPTQRRLAEGFVEGFEAAPMDQMSAVAVAGETLEDGEQYIVPAGYDAVVDALEAELDRKLVTLHVSSPCREVRWHRGGVNVRTRVGEWRAAAAIVSVPLGVLQTRAVPGRLMFSPALRSRAAVAARMGFGDVLRITLRFDGRRWRSLLPQELRTKSRRGFGFVHAEREGINVWWSLLPAPLLTGWAGGPNATALSRCSDAVIAERTLAGLAALLQRPVGELRSSALDIAAHNWSRDPFSCGAYSYTRAGEDEAARTLRAPIEDTLFWAGEATAEGEEVGTVHGALASGVRAAKEALAALR